MEKQTGTMMGEEEKREDRDHYDEDDGGKWDESLLEDSDRARMELSGASASTPNLGMVKRNGTEDLLSMLHQIMAGQEKLEERAHRRMVEELERQDERAQRRMVEEQKNQEEREKRITEELEKQEERAQRRMVEEQKKIIDELKEHKQEQVRQIQEQYQVIVEKFESWEQRIDGRVQEICSELSRNITTKMEGRIEAQDKAIESLHVQVKGVSQGMERKIENCKRELADTKVELKESVAACRKEVQKDVRKCEDDIAELQIEVQELKEVKTAPNVGGGPVNIAIPSSLKFSGDVKENPYSFMRAVERYLAVSCLPEKSKTQVIYQMLQDNARTWADTITPFPNTVTEFKQMFFRRYWSEDIQLNFKMGLMNSMYKPSGGGGMRDYAARRIMDFRSLSPPMSDQEIMCILIRQFPTTTQNLLRSACHTDLEKFQDALGSFDLTFANAPKNRNEVNVNAMMVRGAQEQERGGKQSARVWGDQRGGENQRGYDRQQESESRRNGERSRQPNGGNGGEGSRGNEMRPNTSGTGYNPNLNEGSSC